MSEGFKQIGPTMTHGPQGQAVPGSNDRLMAENTIGGPLALKDVRMFLDKQTLEFLLRVANQSLVGTVRLDHCGLKVKLYQGTDGNRYEVWQLISTPPVAMSSPLGPSK